MTAAERIEEVVFDADDFPLGEFVECAITIAPSAQKVIDLAAARLNELEAEIAVLRERLERQTTRLAVWIGREAAEA